MKKKNIKTTNIYYFKMENNKRNRGLEELINKELKTEKEISVIEKMKNLLPWQTIAPGVIGAILGGLGLPPNKELAYSVLIGGLPLAAYTGRLSEEYAKLSSGDNEKYKKAPLKERAKYFLAGAGASEFLETTYFTLMYLLFSSIRKGISKR